jgi:hypothetical protein
MANAVPVRRAAMQRRSVCGSSSAHETAADEVEGIGRGDRFGEFFQSAAKNSPASRRTVRTRANPAHYQQHRRSDCPKFYP